MGVIAAIYTRISSDDGSALGVQRQRRDCEKLAKRLGWRVSGVYEDNDQSAFSGKRRPAYERLLSDLQQGIVNALVVWDVDRLTRTPVELEGIIDLAEQKGVALASVGGEIDLGTPQGRLTARIKASVARHEVEQQSRRLKRKFLERAQNGLTHGFVPYGWERTERGDVALPEQAAVIQEAAHRIIAGESMRSISVDFTERGLPTPRGKERWHPVTLRQLVLRERNAGLRIHQKQVIGKGNWEPILSEDELAAVTAILRDPTRKTARDTGRRHLLSGIAICGKCGGTIRVLCENDTRPRAYVCADRSCVRRKLESVDELVNGLIVARLAMPDALRLLTCDEDLTQLVAAAQTLRARLDHAADEYADGVLDGAQLARITGRLRPELDELNAEISKASGRPDLVDLARPDIAQRWADIPLERRRAVIRLLLEVTILPVGKGRGGARFEPSGIGVAWLGASEA